MHCRSQMHLSGQTLASDCWPGLDCWHQCSLLQASVMIPAAPAATDWLSDLLLGRHMHPCGRMQAQPSLAALVWNALLAPVQHVAAVHWSPMYPAATGCLLNGCCLGTCTVTAECSQRGTAQLDSAGLDCPAGRSGPACLKGSMLQVSTQPQGPCCCRTIAVCGESDVPHELLARTGLTHQERQHSGCAWR